MKKSFSLIEVLIFIAILSVFMVTSASVITVSMHQNSLQINKLKATHYNNQLLEWIRSEKEIDWNSLEAKASPSSVYCFCDEALAWTTAIGDKNNCCPTPLSGLFRRYLTLTASTYAPTGFSSTSQIAVTIYTEWQGAGNAYSSKLHTLFSQWEE